MIGLSRFHCIKDAVGGQKSTLALLAKGDPKYEAFDATMILEFLNVLALGLKLWHNLRSA